jgi:hypothetical protein
MFAMVVRTSPSDRESSGATRHKVGSDGDHAKYS